MQIFCRFSRSFFLNNCCLKLTSFQPNSMIQKRLIVSSSYSDNKRAHRIIRFLDDQNNIQFGECGETLPKKGQNVRLLKKANPFGDLKLSLDLNAKFMKILSPIIPSQIICIGLNYRKHAEEAKKMIPKYPVVFMKCLHSIQDPNGPVIIPQIAQNPPEVDYEGELAVILKKDCKDIKKEDYKEYVAGYTVANDISARRWQGSMGGNQWCRAKSFDTFCPLGPVLVTPEAIPDPNNLRISTHLNNECMQDSSTSDMIFSIPEIISELSKDTTLPAGTVILTGTPEGVGFARDPPIYLAEGDVIAVEIEKIGKLRNPISRAK